MMRRLTSRIFSIISLPRSWKASRRFAKPKALLGVTGEPPPFRYGRIRLILTRSPLWLSLEGQNPPHRCLPGRPPLSQRLRRSRLRMLSIAWRTTAPRMMTLPKTAYQTTQGGPGWRVFQKPILFRLQSLRPRAQLRLLARTVHLRLSVLQRATGFMHPPSPTRLVSSLLSDLFQGFQPLRNQYRRSRESHSGQCPRKKEGNSSLTGKIVH